MFMSIFICYSVVLIGNYLFGFEEVILFWAKLKNKKELLPITKRQ